MVDGNFQSDDPWAQDRVPLYERIISVIFHLNQPTYITLLFTAIFYIIISTYYISFFNRLSLPFYVLNLPLAFYLNAGFYILKIIIFILLIIPTIYLICKFFNNLFVTSIRLNTVLSMTILKRQTFFLRLLEKMLYPYRYTNRRYNNKKFVEFDWKQLIWALIKSFSLYLIVIVAVSVDILLFNYYFPRLPTSVLEEINLLSGKIWTYYILVGFIYIFFIASVLGAAFLDPIIKILDHKKIHALLFIFSSITFLFVITYIPYSIGTYSAEDLITGEADHFEVSSIYLENKSIALPNTTYILIMQSNGNYYLSEKKINAKDCPNIVYILPEKQIQRATIKWINSSRSSNIAL